MTVEVSYDQSALDSKIQSLQAVTAEQVPAQSAYPKFDGEKFVIEPEVIGTAVNMDVLKEKVHQYISEFQTELDMSTFESLKRTFNMEEEGGIVKNCLNSVSKLFGNANEKIQETTTNAFKAIEKSYNELSLTLKNEGVCSCQGL